MVSPILVIALTLFLAFSIPLLHMLSKKLPPFVPPLATLINLWILITNIKHVGEGAMLITTAGLKPPIAINLAIDKFSLLFAILIQVIGFLLSIYYLSQERKDMRFYMLFLLNILGASGIVMTGDLFNSFVFLEILEISSFGLVASGKDKKALEGGFKYMMIGAIGSSLYLLGIIVLYLSTGTLNMAHIAKLMPSIPDSVKLFSSILFLIGIGVEVELFPLNAWAPDAYQGAMDEISTQLSSIISKTGIYLAARIFLTIYGGLYATNIIFYLAITTFIVAELAALMQKNVKRMLAYSSVGQMGLLMLILSVFAKRGDVFVLTTAILLALNHAFGKGLLFLSLGSLTGNTRNYDIEDLKGAGRANPVLGFLFATGVLSIIGMPIFFGFWSKISLLISIMKANLMYLLALLLLVFLVELYYYANVIVNLFKGEGKKYRIGVIPVSVMLLFALSLIVFGLWPHPVFKIAQNAAASLMERSMYISSILGGM